MQTSFRGSSLMVKNQWFYKWEPSKTNLVNLVSSDLAKMGWFGVKE